MIKVGNIYEFDMGWFIGNFEPALVKTKDFEIAIHRHQAKTRGDNHIHKIATEYNFVIDGEVCLDSHITLRQNSYWVTEPNQSIEVSFREYTTLLVIKIPSVPGDKYTNLKLLPEQLEDINNWKPSKESAQEFFQKFPVESKLND